MIGDYARQNADNLADVRKFVILTIQQQLSSAVKQSRGEQAANLFGFKLQATHNVERDKLDIFDNCEELFKAGKLDELLCYLADQHGFGLVKAGFVCQLVYGFSGCIDTHNLKLFNIKSKAVRYNNGAKYATRIKKARVYNKLITLCGGTEHLWDTWCDYVAENNKNTYNGGYDVSERHVQAIIKEF